ncbi:MAG: acyl-CoA dehydrogenase family protein [Acidimicrobiales bacterium]
MELALTDDQELLAATAVRFMDEVCPLAVVRQMVGEPSDLPPGYLRAAAELGWFSLLVPEELGGGSVSGNGLCDAAVVAEERGRRLQPGPFVPMNVVAAALAACGSAEQHRHALGPLLDGAAVATWVASDGGGRWAPAAAVSAEPVAGGFALSGRAGAVQGAAAADWLLVTAAAPAGPSQFLVAASTPGLSVRPLESHDITQRFADVELDRVAVAVDALVGAAGGAEEDIERQFEQALVLSVAETVGALDALFEMTRQYAVDRTAFGRPIGSFQAVKHQLADLSLSVEAAKAVSAAATRAVSAGQAEAGEIASMAKAWVGDAGIEVAQGCFQVFAGIGYTWEHDLHLFLRRLTMNGLLFGQADWHRERICRIHGL